MIISRQARRLLHRNGYVDLELYLWHFVDTISEARYRRSKCSATISNINSQAGISLCAYIHCNLRYLSEADAVFECVTHSRHVSIEPSFIMRQHHPPQSVFAIDGQSAKYHTFCSLHLREMATQLTMRYSRPKGASFMLQTCCFNAPYRTYT
jgi:hypothetical protein